MSTAKFKVGDRVGLTAQIMQIHSSECYRVNLVGASSCLFVADSDLHDPAAIRNAALEEAATLLDEQAVLLREHNDHILAVACVQYAATIRALKTAPTAGEGKG